MIAREKWVDCTRITGVGRVSVGENRAFWDVKAELGSVYMPEMKIRVLADNEGLPFNVGWGDSEPFTIDTKPPVADAGRNIVAYVGSL